MGIFIATYNQTAIEKIKDVGREPFAKSVKILADDQADAFKVFRQMNRTAYGIDLISVDFSVYEPIWGMPSEFGFLDRDL